MDAVVVWRILFKRFTPLLGPLSTELLFARSLAAHETAFPWLPQALSGTTAALLGEFERSLDARSPEDILAANTALLATYLNGLGDLIGAGLVTRFVEATFPQDEPNKNKE